LAEHPVQLDAPADAPTVSPVLPLLKKPQADIRRAAFSLLHPVHFGVSLPMIRHSKFLPQSLQWYS